MQPEEQRDDRTPYTAIPRTLVFLRRGNALLLLKGAPHKRLWAEKYNGLGGHIEPGETPRQAARREVEEESGLQIEALHLRALVHVTLPHPPGVLLFVFVGTCPTGGLRASEEGEPEWVPIEALSAYPLVEDLPELLPRILEPGPLVYATYRFTPAGLEMHFD
ncbi:MAG: NUDIX hydrolase [Anaerolineales bacterium]